MKAVALGDCLFFVPDQNPYLYHMPQPTPISAFRKFMSSSMAGSILLFTCLLLSLAIANSPLAENFNKFLNTELGYASAAIHLKYTISIWINDGLMAVFFLLVGLEIKRELIDGELSTPKKAALPILCALGGALIPAIIYTLFNSGKITAAGWGIPMATDIAFALAILSLLGDKVPVSLKIFLAALAIADDLLAILVIAVFYSSEFHLMNLTYAVALFLLLLLFNRMGLKNLLFYIVPGTLIWYFVHHSGIHATIAGVLVALTIPSAADHKQSSLLKLEHFLTNPVNLLIIPIFALANTNIHFEPGMISGLFTGLGMGIILGLVVGKPIGILLVSWVSVKLKISELPKHAGWNHVLGVGLLAGIGFTMSIFISLLSFTDAEMVAEAKFAVLTGSVISGLTGYLVLYFSKRLQGKSIERPAKNILD